MTWPAQPFEPAGPLRRPAALSGLGTLAGGVSDSARGTGAPGIYRGDFTSKGSIAGSRPTAGPALKAF